MLFYALLFIILGVTFKLLLSEKILYPAIIVTTVLWAFAFGPWAILTFFELVIGVTIVESIKSNTNTKNQNSVPNQNTSLIRKAHIAPISKSHFAAKEKNITPTEDTNFDIEIKKLNDAYSKELNKNNW